MGLTYAAKSDAGMRRSQEDCFCVCESGGALMAVVCDGLGGHAGGAVASKTVCKTAERLFNAAPPTPENAAQFLKNLIKTADFELLAIGARTAQTPMTTIAIALFFESRAYFAHIGDSRVYIFDGGKMLSRTKDHTALQEKFDELGAGGGGHSNVLTRCLGGYVGGDIEISACGLAEGMLFVLCSDGFWDNVSPADLASLHDLDNADAVMKKALETGGKTCDNATFIAVKI